MTPQWYVETLIWHGWNTCRHPSFAEMWAEVAGGSLFPRENEAGLLIMLVLYLLDQYCFAGVCSITFAFPFSLFSLSIPPQDKYPQQKNNYIQGSVHDRGVSTESKAEHGVAERDEWKRSENVRERCMSLRGSSGRLGALPRPSSFSLGRPCSPLSASGERKRTKDLLLGPDMYTFLVLFFSPRPLGHTKGL